MKSTTNFLIHRPIAVFTSTLSLLAVSLLVVWQIPLQVLPTFDIPVLMVEAEMPEANPFQVEEQLLAPLRGELLNLQGLEEVESFALGGKGNIRLRYRWGTNMKYAYLRLNERIDQSLRLLPAQSERPRILRMDVSDLPILQLSLASEQRDPFELSDFALNVLKRRFEQLDGIAKCEVLGGSTREVSIRPRLDRLRELGISIEALRRHIQAADYQLGSVRFKDGPYEYNLEIASAFHTVESLGALHIKVGKDRLVPLSYLADIQYEPRPASSFMLRNGQPVLLLNLYKQQDANLLQVAARAREALAGMQQQYSSVQLNVADDPSGFIRFSLASLQQSLLYGACFAVLLLFAFLSSLRAPFIMLCTVPLSLFLSFLGFYLLGLSFNLLSLAGLAIGVGVLIDNGIIVVENIDRLRQQQAGLEQAITTAVSQITLPLLASTFTTLSIFAPLAFAGELLGHFFREQALAISLALGSSLLAALFFLPVLYRSLYRRVQPRPAAKGRWQLRLQQAYHHGLQRVLQRPGLGLLLALLLLLAAAASGGWLRREVFPAFTAQVQLLSIDWPPATSMAENRLRAEALSAYLLQQHGLEQVVVQGGSVYQQGNARIYGQNHCLLFLKLEEEAALPALRAGIGQWMARHHPQAAYQLQNAPNIFSQLFPQNAFNLSLFLSDPQQNGLPSAAQTDSLKSWLQRQPAIQAYDFPYQAAVQAYSIIPDLQALSRYDISPAELATALETVLGRKQLSKIQTFDKQTAIVMQAPRQAASLKGLLAQARLGQQQIGLDKLVALQPVNRPQYLYARKTGLCLPLQLQVPPAETSSLLQQLQSAAQKWGLMLETSSEYGAANRLSLRMGLLLAVAAALLFLVMAAQFESLRQPFIIILTLPFGWAGALLLLWLSGQSLNLMSGIGMVVVSGIVVNDSILKVDAANRLLKSGLNKRTALLEAGLIRFRPIILTTLTTMLAVLPIIFSQGLGRVIQLPLSVAIIGGIAAGTLASLYVIPLLYLYLAKDQPGVQPPNDK